MTDLTKLDPERIAEVRNRILTQLQELRPDLDLQRGAFSDLLVYLHAVLAEADRAEIDRYLAARSLLAVSQADPDQLDADVLDHLLSNYKIQRKQGARSYGSVVIVLSEPLPTTIAANTRLTVANTLFRTTDVFTARTDDAQILTPNDRLLTPAGSGRWAFRVDVAAAEPAYVAVAKDAVFDLETPPRGFVTAYAEHDFASGSDTESNRELIARMEAGIAARGPGSRTNMRAMLLEYPQLNQTYVRGSIIGHGDAEMLRDKRSLIPVASGGCVDWYMRTSTVLRHSPVVKTATLIGTNPANHTAIWQVSFSRDEFPGFYEVFHVGLPGEPGDSTGNAAAVITADTRGLDSRPLAPDLASPNIQDPADAAYSPFQTAVISFEYPTAPGSPAVVGAHREFELTIRHMPSLVDMQRTLTDRQNRSVGSDLLIRAAVPCFVTTSVRLAADSDADIESIKDAVKSAVARAINETGFTGVIHGTRLAEAARAAGDIQVEHVSSVGRIRAPDGDNLYLSGENLRVPDAAHRSVGARTVQFYARPDDILVSVITGADE